MNLGFTETGQPIVAVQEGVNIIDGGIGTMSVAEDETSLVRQFVDIVYADQEETIKQKKVVHKTRLVLRTFVSAYQTFDEPVIEESFIDDAGRQVIAHSERFPKAWEAYQNKKSDVYGGGFPLKNWAVIPDNIAMLLELSKIYTVEHLVNRPTSQINNIPDLEKYKELGRNFLKAQADGSAILKQQDEIDALKKQIEMLMASGNKDKPNKNNKSASELAKEEEEAKKKQEEANKAGNGG